MIHRLAQQGVPMTLEVYQLKLAVLKFQHISEPSGRLIATPSAGPTPQKSFGGDQLRAEGSWWFKVLTGSQMLLVWGRLFENLCSGRY